MENLKTLQGLTTAFDSVYSNLKKTNSLLDEALNYRDRGKLHIEMGQLFIRLAEITDAKDDYLNSNVHSHANTK